MCTLSIISSNIKETRKKRGFTQEEVSKLIGISRSTIAKWENGSREPNALELKKLCELFNVSSDYIYGRSDSFNNINIPKEYNLDINRLNSMGKHVFISHFKYLLTQEIYTK